MAGVKQLTATVWKEGDGFVAQCLEVDVATQGRTEEEAIANLREALELHFTPPVATAIPELKLVRIAVGAA